MEQADEFDILDATTNEVISHCFGPTAQGRCPLASRNGIVFCHGCRVAGAGTGPEYWNLWVPPDSQHCPQAWNLESLGY